MDFEDNRNTKKNGWTEYSHLVLNKLDELHNDYKDIKRSLDVINERLTKLESSQKDTEELQQWQKNVTDAWSPTQMKEAKDELYKQKEKWTGAWFIFIGMQMAWAAIVAFKDDIFK